MSLLPKINIVIKSCPSKNVYLFFTHNDFDPGNDEWTSKPSLPCFLRFHCLAKDGGGSHLLPVGCRQEGPLGNFLFKLRYSSSSPKIPLAFMSQLCSDEIAISFLSILGLTTFSEAPFAILPRKLTDGFDMHLICWLGIE